MNKIQQYLHTAGRNVNQEFVGIDGFSDWTGGDDGSEFFNADAAPTAQAVSALRSQPYILNVVNSSTAQSIDLFGAYQYLNNAGFSAGSLVIGTVTISSGISNTTYYNLLNQSSVSPFTIGSTLLSATSAVVAQVLQPITLTTQDANGNQAIKVLTPTIDPYQNQSGVIELKQPFRIDGFTKLTFTVLASSSIQFQFYPSDNINIARGLGGNPVSRQYGNPQLIRPAAR
jgi:hypothetical protein